MSKRTFNLIVGIAGGVQAIAVAIVTAVAPPYAVPIVAAICFTLLRYYCEFCRPYLFCFRQNSVAKRRIAETAVVEVCAQFRTETGE